MSSLTPDQRNAIYLQEAERVGIHKPVLAALYIAQQQPPLTDGETGLGIAPANRISLEQVNTFAAQVQYAANTIRSLTNRLTVEGWKSTDLWDGEKGRYTDKFMQAIAKGFNAPVNDPAAAILETSNAKVLTEAYQADVATDFAAASVPTTLVYLDRALLNLLDRLPGYYLGLPYQREALLEMVRIWRKLDSREQAIASLNSPSLSASNTEKSPTETRDETVLEPALLQFVQRVSPNYSGYPHQREALIRLTQLWRQLASREAAIASLETDTSPEPNLKLVDPALITFLQRIPAHYRAQGEQRNALVEGFRLWGQLETRSAALIALGVNADLFTSPKPNQTELAQAAVQLDRALLDFVRRIPTAYEGLTHQRDALLRLTQLWRGIATHEQTIQSLFDDLKRMQTARRGGVDAPLPPLPLSLPSPPPAWTPGNIQIYAPIIPNGNFTWAEATHGGTRMPPNQAIVDAIVRMAQMAQIARDRLNRPMYVTSWYCPPDINARVGGVAHSRHIVGDAMDFYCDGLTGDQLYWFLDPWWPGGLGRYSSYPYLIHLDAQHYQARWLR